MRAAITNLFIPYKLVINCIFTAITFFGVVLHLYEISDLIDDPANLIFVAVLTLICFCFQGIFLSS